MHDFHPRCYSPTVDGSEIRLTSLIWRIIQNLFFCNSWAIHKTGWWFQIFVIFTPTWGNDPI